VTLYFINLDDSREMFGSGWSYGTFEIEGKAPSFNWDDVMTDENHDHWFPMFEAVVTMDGKLVGSYRFTTRVQFTPNTPHGKGATPQ